MQWSTKQANKYNSLNILPKENLLNSEFNQKFIILAHFFPDLFQVWNLDPEWVALWTQKDINLCYLYNQYTDRNWAQLDLCKGFWNTDFMLKEFVK